MSDGDNKKDLTRIEDLSEFLHQGDDELDKLLADLDEDDDSTDDHTHQESDLNDGLEDEAEIELSPFDYSTPDNEQEEPEEILDETQEDGAFFDASETDDLTSDSDQDFAEFEDFDNFENLEDQDGQLTEDSDDNFSEDFNEEDFSNEESDEGLVEITDETPYIENEEEAEAEEEFEENFQAQSPPIPEQQALGPEAITPPRPKAQEDFSEVRDFAANSTYGKVAMGGNPPFSLLMQGIRSSEHDESILAILNEHGLLSDNEELYRLSLESGQLLIAHIGEFSAIYLAGKLRRYCRTIKVALAHEIHLSKSYNHEDQRGLTGPKSILQNRMKSYKKADTNFNRNDILLSSSPYIPGLMVTHSLGPMQINEKIDANEFDDINSINLIDFFEDKMKDAAFEKGANAITSIHFTINQQELNDTKYIIILAHGDYVVLEEHNE